MKQLFPALGVVVEAVASTRIPPERMHVLQPLIRFIQQEMERQPEVHLNFICTHNSRRSQFAQLWMHTFAHLHGLPIRSYSGGVEITALNERAVESLRRSGFRLDLERAGANPLYAAYFSPDLPPLRMLSKRFDDPANASERFAAVMTCSHADENCPFIPGAAERIAVRYDDPKEFDNTAEEAARYDERSHEIASEMHYVCAEIAKPS
jgi:arsenate reductase